MVNERTHEVFAMMLRKGTLASPDLRKIWQSELDLMMRGERTDLKIFRSVRIHHREANNNQGHIRSLAVAAGH